MEKLELKHFLQHYNENLDILVYNENGKTIDYIAEILLADDCIITGQGEEFYYNSDENYCSVKLILRPLSDLDNFRKEILKLQEINNDVALLFLNGFCYKELSVWEYEFLLENNFDVYGLIKKGLAVDINTI